MYRMFQSTMRTDEQVDRLFMTQATPSLFTTLGARAAVGRLPSPEDDPFQVAVISHALWTSWFGADSSVIGRSYEMSGQLRTVIGVMEPDFRFPDERVSLWIHAMLGDEADITPGNFGFNLVGRMTDGTGHEGLAAEPARSWRGRAFRCSSAPLRRTSRIWTPRASISPRCSSPPASRFSPRARSACCRPSGSRGPGSRAACARRVA